MAVHEALLEQKVFRTVRAIIASITRTFNASRSVIIYVGTDTSRTARTIYRSSVCANAAFNSTIYASTAETGESKITSEACHQGAGSPVTAEGKKDLHLVAQAGLSDVGHLFCRSCSGCRQS